MKKLILTFIIALGVFILKAQNVNVTFQVDMSNETVNANGVHIAGNFQLAAGFPSDWDPGTTQLIDSTSNGIYEVTVSIPSGTYEFKFINGNAWGNDETVPAACGVGNGPYNREVVIGSNDTSLTPIFYGTCLASTPPKMVVFQVGMKGQVIDPNGIHVAGNFQQAAGFISNWDPTTTELTDPDGDSIYTDTVMIPAGTIEYKFINGNVWPNEENVPSSCGVPNGSGGYNRSLVFSGDTTIPDVCFGSCQSCAAPPTPTYNVTFRVDLSTYPQSFGNAFVSGTFNGWNGTLDTLFDLNGDTVFETTLPLSAGTYEYKFQLDNWTVPELFTGNEICVTQSPGNANRIFTVSGDTTLGEYCFNSCAACPSAPPIFREVVFSVDMNDYGTPFNSVYVSGTFNSWCGTCDELTDLDFDGIFTDTVLIPTDTNIFYKFSIDNWTAEEVFTVADSACTDTLGGSYNRVLFINQDTVLSTPCFNSCSACPPRPQLATTFITDMKFNTVDPSGLFLLGSFNGYDSSSTPLTHLGDSLYAITLNLDSGKTIYYRYLNGSTTEVTAGNCFSTAPNGFVMRSFTPNTQNDTLQTCFNECDTCAASPAQQFYQVTFRVGMFGQNININGVHIAGNFQTAAGFPNNWDPSSTQMTDADGDSVYELTVTIPSDTFQFKFINGNSWNDDEVVPSNCGVGAGPFNREVIVAADTILPDFCFSSCAPCPQTAPPAQVPVTFRVDMRTSSVDPLGVFLTGDFTGWSADSLPMNNLGNDVFSLTLDLDSGSTYQYKFLNGNSFTGEETVPQACGVPNGLGGFNREVSPTQVTMLDSLCFSDCGPCNLNITKQVSVTFSVDMTNENISPSGVFVTGDFNNWGLTPLPNSFGFVYSTTLLLDSTAQYEYKFVNGNSPGTYETVPQACGVSDGFGGYNRSLIAFGSFDLGDVCFAECAGCSNPQPTVDVTFSVDMKNENISSNGVFVAGSFNNYNPKVSELLDNDGDTIYEATVSIEEGTTIAYNFYNGNTLADIEETDSLMTCGTQNSNGIYERTLSVSQTNANPETTCFSSCGDCPDQDGGDIFVNETHLGHIQVQFFGSEIVIKNESNTNLIDLQLIDLSGKVVWNKSLNSSNDFFSFKTPMVSEGIYFVRIQSEYGFFHQKLLISQNGKY